MFLTLLNHLILEKYGAFMPFCSFISVCLYVSIFELKICNFGVKLRCLP